MILETFARVYVDAASLDSTSAFYCDLLDGAESLRFDYPEAGLVIAEVSGPSLSVLIVAGPPEKRQPFEATRLTVKVDRLEPHIDALVAAGGEQIEPVQPTPVGRKTRFRHADGLIVEYVDHTVEIGFGGGVPAGQGMCRILLICGSLRDGSTNAAVTRTVQALDLPGIAAVAYPGLSRLPAFDPDRDDPELDGARLPHAAAALRQAVEQADALLFCTPEYAGALPGALKNLLDWCIGGTGLHGKAVGWINAAPEGRGVGAHDNLRTVLGYAGARFVEPACRSIPVGRETVGADGTIADATTRSAIAEVVARLVAGAMQP